MTTNLTPLTAADLVVGQSYPDPPAGRKWHNPEGLTPEQVGVAEGWRLCLEDEVDDIDDLQFWTPGSTWMASARVGETFRGSQMNYRTKHPLPGPKRTATLRCWRGWKGGVA